MASTITDIKVRGIYQVAFRNRSEIPQTGYPLGSSDTKGNYVIINSFYLFSILLINAPQPSEIKVIFEN
jgi:hypothetical protein